jgi:hypothetical protein
MLCVDEKKNGKSRGENGFINIDPESIPSHPEAVKNLKDDHLLNF